MAKSLAIGVSRLVDRAILTATLAFSGGALVGLVALAFASRASHGTGAILIYGVCLVLCSLFSYLYNMLETARRRRLLRYLDHAAIFLLIAGTYTPFVLIALRGVWGWTLFAIVWSLAAVGTLIELSQLARYRRLMVALYIAMGWVGLIAIKPLVAALPAAGLWLLFGGGVSYTFGVVFYRWHSLRYHHAVWHLFVLGGSVLQYFAVLYYVLPSA
jgi:hemolysin III